MLSDTYIADAVETFSRRVVGFVGQHCGPTGQRVSPLISYFGLRPGIADATAGTSQRVSGFSVRVANQRNGRQSGEGSQWRDVEMKSAIRTVRPRTPRTRQMDDIRTHISRLPSPLWRPLPLVCDAEPKTRKLVEKFQPSRRYSRSQSEVWNQWWHSLPVGHSVGRRSRRRDEKMSRLHLLCKYQITYSEYTTYD